MSHTSQQIGGGLSSGLSKGIVVNKRSSNIIKSPKKGGSNYSNYLKFQKEGGGSCGSSGPGDPSRKVLEGGCGSKKITISNRSNSRNRSGGGRIKPCKNQKKKQEIPEIPILEKVQRVKKEEKKEDKKEDKKDRKDDKRRSSQKRVSRVSRGKERVSKGKRVSRVSRGKERVSRGKERVSRVSRARANRVSRGNRGTRNVRGRRGSLQKEKKGRKVSVSTSRTIGKKETQKMQKKIKEIQNKSSDDMIQELKKGGIEVSGKSKTILKDIYMYQQMCGINIKRE